MQIADLLDLLLQPGNGSEQIRFGLEILEEMCFLVIVKPTVGRGGSCIGGQHDRAQWD